MISDAHRQSVDLIAWHPSGHLLATASHDSILKFWCREPYGSKLDYINTESSQENPPQCYYGPLDSEKLDAFAAKATASNAMNQLAQGKLPPSGATTAPVQSGGSFFRGSNNFTGKKRNRDQRDGRDFNKEYQRDPRDH